MNLQGIYDLDIILYVNFISYLNHIQYISQTTNNIQCSYNF